MQNFIKNQRGVVTVALPMFPGGGGAQAPDRTHTNFVAVVKQVALGLAVSLALWAGSARADTTISNGVTFTIDNSNTTLSGNTRTWNDTGTLTMYNGATLQTWPSQINTVANNDAIVFKGSGGTITLRFNDNDTDFMMNGSSITSTATGAQTLDIRTGYNGNGDRESVTFNAGIPNVGDGSALSLTVTFRCQTGSQSWLNLNAVNTFTGPITLVAGSGPATGYLTIGGTLTRYNGNTFGSGTLNSGNYAGDIALGAATILNYASTAPQTLAGAISGAGALQVTGTGTLTLSGGNTYTTNTTVNSGGTLVLGSSGGLKFIVTDATNNKVTGGGTATLNGTFTLDTTAVTVTSNSWTLVNTTTKSFGGTFSVAGFTGSVSNGFTKVAGGQTWTFTTNGVLNLASKAIITSLNSGSSTGVINQVAKTIALTVPYGTSLTNLAPTYTLTSGTCTPASGSPPSPTFAVTNPATYRAVDGTTTNDYTVTVSVTPASTNKDILTFTFPSQGDATIIGTNILMSVAPNVGLTNLAPTYTLSPFATASPLSGSTNNFTSPVTYTVTAQNGSTKAYLVTVQTYAAWSNSASLYILTTPEGANLPGSASESNFPVLVRLNSDFFNFSQAKTNGADLRFTTAAGVALPYQIEQWDTNSGTAGIWVKVPVVAGNARQELKMYWNRANAVSESNGSNVFNAANGFASVLHMDATLKDEVGTLVPANSGTTAATGMIGSARHFVAGQGVNCGNSITAFPTGANPHSSEAWFRADASGNTLMGWGIEQGQGKVVMQLQSPPHINMDCYFGGGGVSGASTLALSQWYHVAHTYTNGMARIYVNGVLDGTNTSGSMNIPSPAQMWLGGWGGGYNFAGDLDEVRISKVTRSANWVKMEYENQKPLQTMAGWLVPTGTTFSVTPSSLTILENTSTNLTAQAGGAQKVYWILKQNGQETVVAVDRFNVPFTAGRVLSNQSFVLQFKAIYPTGVQTNDISVTISNSIPEPIFTLVASTYLWDGRQTMTVTPNISNWAALQAAGVTNLNYNWSVAGVAVTAQTPPGMTTPGTYTTPTLTLLRSQGSGTMTVTLVLHNGGALVTNTATITVQEPVSDAWVARTPGATEKPVNNQFFARNPETGLGTIYYNGTQGGSPSSVFLKVYTNGVLYANLSQTLVGGAYAFTAPVPAGLTTNTVQYGTITGGTTNVLNTVTNLVCGDAYLIDGQSNALATDNSAPNDSTTDPWIRTYGLTLGWGYAISKGTEMQLGLWGWNLAKRIVTNHNMPVFIIQGAVGGTRIDQHQANPADHSAAGSSYSIYANIYNRVVGAKLTHGIRGVFWHQGENNSGAAAPTGDYDYKSYQSYFVNMAGAWKQDFPNIQRYIIYQVMPKPCSMGPTGDQLREAQRTLPRLFSKMNILCTLALPGYEGCHFSPAGYTNFAILTAPLVGQDFYGIVPPASVTAPNLQRAYFTTTNRTEIALEFDQNMAWNSFSTANYWLDRFGSRVSSGSASGNVVKLQLSVAGTTNSTLDYLEDDHWSYNAAPSDLLYGTNGIAALTFADVPIATSAPIIEVGDGIPNAWRALYWGGLGTNTNSSSCATCDATGTGQNNLFKYNADLNPTNPASRLAIISITKTNSNTRITWIGGGSNAMQILQSSAQLTTNTVWNNIVTNIPASAPSLTNYLDNGAVTNGHRFYRVRAYRNP